MKMGNKKSLEYALRRLEEAKKNGPAMKLIVNKYQWDAFEKAGYDMSMFMLTKYLPPDNDTAYLAAVGGTLFSAKPSIEEKEKLSDE